MAKADLTAQRLRELVHYDPATGLFTRRVTGNGVRAGDIMGTPLKTGHLKASVDGREYLLNRLAFLYMTGEWPKGDSDHRHGRPADNRWDELRDVTHRENIQNRRKANKNSKSGLLGASWRKDRGNWTARIFVGNKYLSLGSYPTAQQAHEAYVEAKRKFHSGNTL